MRKTMKQDIVGWDLLRKKTSKIYSTKGTMYLSLSKTNQENAWQTCIWKEETVTIVY